MRTYQVVVSEMGGRKVAGTITLDAGKITNTVTPGYELAMQRIMDCSVLQIAEGDEEDISLTRASNPEAWFEWLPTRYHGSALYVAEVEKTGKAREKSA